MEGEVTKTNVADDGHFTWSVGDKIWLQTSNGFVEGVLTTGTGSSNATFAYGPYIGSMTGRAVYPYSSHAISGNILSVDMPAVYELGANTDNTNAAMYAVSPQRKQLSMKKKQS